jgi:hypothetical protein
MRLIWQTTGDTLDINVVDVDVIEYWVAELNKASKNSFGFVQSTLPADDVLVQLADCLASTNQILEKFRIDPLMDANSDWLNQNNLNVLHERWVKLQHQYNIVGFLDKLNDKTVVEKFHNVNHLIHRVERCIKVDYINDTTTAWQVENIFGPEVTKFGQWHVELHYQNLGRSTFDKWNNYDSNLVDSDTNNFTHFGGLVYFNLGRPCVMTPPTEFVDYCRSNNIKPYGNTLPIGNFKVDLTSLRHIFKRNVGIENNRISFEV